MKILHFFPVIYFIILGLLSCGMKPVREDVSILPEETPRIDKDQPRKDQPRKDQPRKDQPRKDQPRKDQPRKDQSRKEQPGKQKAATDKAAMTEFTAAPGEACIVLLKPNATLGELKDNVYVDGRYKSVKIGNTALSLPVESGEHLIVSESEADTGAMFKLKAGKVYYLVDPNDAESQRTLGDILYEKKNLTGALTAYRHALEADPALTGFYKRYAELVISKKGKDEEIIKALDGVVRSNEADISTHLTLGKIYQKKADKAKTADLKKPDYTKAVEMYEKALEFEPQNKEALQSIAECKVNLGETKGAAEAYENVIKVNPAAVKEYKVLGDLYSKQQQTAKAMSAYRKFIDKGGKDQVLTKKLGTYYYNTKQYEDAAKYLAMVRGKQGQRFDHQRMLANSYYNAGKYKKAVTTFKVLNSRNPKVQIKKDILRKLAESYVQLNDNPKALFWFKKYQKISKGKDRNVSYLSAFLQEKISPAKAQKIYEANTRTFPRDHRNFLRLGLMYSKRRNTLSKSATMLKKAASLVDTIPTVWLELAKVYGKLRKTDNELSAYKKYINTDPENLEANIRVGLILLDRGKVKEGMDYLEKAHKKSPDNIKVMVALSKGYVHTNRTQEAIDLLAKAKKLKPDDLAIRKQLFDIYKAKGEDQKAIDEIKQLLQIKRDNETLLLYAQLLMKSDDLAGAENAVEDIRATDPENIEALMILATIYRENKKYTDAIDIYKEVLMIKPQYALAFNGQADVHMLQNKVLWAEKLYQRALKADSDFALAELGLAKIALIRKDNAKYKKHIGRAYLLDPDDPAIKEEYKKSKQ